MTSRERVLAVFEGKLPDRCPIDFQATPDAEAMLTEAFGLSDAEALREYLGSDIRVVSPVPKPANLGVFARHLFVEEAGPGRWLDNWGLTWQRVEVPAGDVFFDVVDAPLKDVAEVAEVEDYPFPKPGQDWDFSGLRDEALRHSGRAVAGQTAAVFDDAWRLLGLEKMFIDIALRPELVHAVLRKVCDYWLEFARLEFEAAAGALDLMWIFDDLGTQNGLVISPETCREFVLPLIRERAELCHSFGARAILHCCGGIEPIIEDMIAAGVDALNPIQSAPRGMDRRLLKARYGDRLVFHGSVDEQRVLVPGTPDDVAADARECIDTLGAGGGYIVAASHKIETDISPENVKAMFFTAMEHGRYS
ncbi:MAG: uroporphyrinogen decarboxylase family protein [Candidatus Brocadiia bacterium]|nr:uroporphyrinogen decarboxylase family protein [Candidatus Brocadiia bacterium]